jgi:competence protein ComEC
LMGAAVSQVLEVSAWVGGIDGSSIVIPALGIGALGFLSLALLVLTIPASSLRWLAVLPAGAGLAFAAVPDRYDVYIDRDGAGAAIRSANGQLTLVGKPSAFVAEQWLRADGDGRSADDKSLRQDARCDRAGCIVDAGAQRHIAFIQDFSAFEEDCRRAAIIITRLRAPPKCNGALLLDREALALRGATTISLGGETIELRSVRKGREMLPWPGPKRTAIEGRSAAQERPRQAQPVPEQDLPDEEISSGEPD